MKTIPTVSVLIPAFNAQNTISAALESVCAQTVKPTEVIVVDDGSTDGTQSAVQAFIKTHSDCTIRLISVANGGASKARNIAICLSQGEYIAFLDSDDAWHAEKLEKQLAAFEAFPRAALVSTSSTVKKRFSLKTTPVPFTRLLIRNHIITSSVLVKASVVKSILFDETLKRAEDYNLWLKIARYNQIVFIDEKLVFFAPKRTFGVSGLSANFHALTADEFRGFARLLKSGTINVFQFLFAVSMTSLKYVRKCIIVYIIRR